MVARVPPTISPDFDLRTWLAGCALMNPLLVTSSDPGEATLQALAAADAMISGLRAAQVPNVETIKAPSEEQMKRWDERMLTETNVRLRAAKTMNAQTVPLTPPQRTEAGEAFASATQHLKKASQSNMAAVRPGSYCVADGVTEQEK
jgi:hypothetical protein